MSKSYIIGSYGETGGVIGNSDVEFKVGVVPVRQGIQAETVVDKNRLLGVNQCPDCPGIFPCPLMS
jgi:hypothetical protein